LAQVGASLQDVVRTRVYVVRLADWREVARAHGEVFSAIRPANTLVQVAGLVEGGPLVEIEADAVIQH
jgi:enamine deaminase RidA (YjgF/YER057c/UK114 family)